MARRRQQWVNSTALPGGGGIDRGLGSRHVQAMNDSFKYDVAISFLSADLDVAQKLNELLRDRMEVFLFTERQGDVVGPDGIDQMNAVYGKEARIAVVLYRDGWGKKGWTGVEETAIKNRGLEQGWDFVLMIPLEEHPTLPVWVPRGNIWLSYPHYGLTAALPVIERLLEQLGGHAQPLTAAAHLAQQARHSAWIRERDSKRSSETDGVAAANQHAAALFAELEKTVTNEPAAGITFKQSRKSVRIWTQAPEQEGTTVTITWSLPYRNVLSRSGLHVMVWEGYASLDGENLVRMEEPRKRATHEFDFEWSESRQWVWQGRQSKRTYDTAGLAAFCMGLLVDLSRRQPRRS